MRPTIGLPTRQLLFSLEAELPSLRQALRSSRLIAEYQDKGASRHPVLNFALACAPVATIESLLLRLAEAVDPFLEEASRAVLARSLFTGKGRKRQPADPTFRLLLRLRSEVVAHRVKMDGLRGPAYAELTSTYTTPFAFLDTALDRVAATLGELRGAGLFDTPGLTAVTVRLEIPFGPDSIARLIAAANGAIDK